MADKFYTFTIKHNVNKVGEFCMFVLKTIDEIEHVIFQGNTQSQTRNFPKSVSFPFGELYRKIVTSIKSKEISAECMLYDSVQSYNITTNYWNDSSNEDLKKYWFVGENGQGDSWVMDMDGKIYFYDHDIEDLAVQNFIDLNISFEQWLKFAYLNKDLETVWRENKYDEKTKQEYLNTLREIGENLLTNYPFDL